MLHRCWVHRSRDMVPVINNPTARNLEDKSSIKATEISRMRGKNLFGWVSSHTGRAFAVDQNREGNQISG